MAQWTSCGKRNFKIKSRFWREILAEFFGTTLLIFLGCCSTAVATFNPDTTVGSIVGPLAWGFSLALALIVTGHLSGHFNPAVTVSLATLGKFPWKKVALFLLAQYLGGFIGAAFVYLNYREAINIFAGEERNISTAQIFATYPHEGISTLTCFLDQVLSTAVLMIVVAAVVDENNLSIPKHLTPLVFFIALSSILYAFSYNCMAPLNPARDVGPRIFTAFTGWGLEVFSYRDYNWFWVPIVGPHVGGILGTWIYYALIERHQPEENCYSMEQFSNKYHCSTTTIDSTDTVAK